MYTCIDKTMQIVLERGSIDGMPNTYACKGVSNPNVPIFPPRVCTLVLFISFLFLSIFDLTECFYLCVWQGKHCFIAGDIYFEKYV